MHIYVNVHRYPLRNKQINKHISFFLSLLSHLPHSEKSPNENVIRICSDPDLHFFQFWLRLRLHPPREPMVAPGISRLVRIPNSDSNQRSECCKRNGMQFSQTTLQRQLWLAISEKYGSCVAMSTRDGTTPAPYWRNMTGAGAKAVQHGGG